VDPPQQPQGLRSLLSLCPAFGHPLGDSFLGHPALGLCDKWEKRFLIVFLILLVYLPFFLHSTSTYVNDPSFEIVLEINRANSEDTDRGTEEKIEDVVEQSSGGPRGDLHSRLMAKRRASTIKRRSFIRRRFNSTQIQRGPFQSREHLSGPKEG